MAAKKDQPEEAPVETAKERPYKDAKADPKEIAKIENRPKKDQIEDYHKTHPTRANG